MLSAVVPGPSGPSSPWARLAVPPVTLAAGLPHPPRGWQWPAPGPPAPPPAAAAAPAPASRPPAPAPLPRSRGAEGAASNRRCPLETSRRPAAAPCALRSTRHSPRLGQQRPSPALRSPRPPGAQRAHRDPAPAGARRLWLLHLRLRCSARPPAPPVPASLLAWASCSLASSGCPPPALWPWQKGRHLCPRPQVAASAWPVRCAVSVLVGSKASLPLSLLTPGSAFSAWRPLCWPRRPRGTWGRG